MPDVYETDSVPLSRVSKDKHTNNYGPRLLDLCKQCSLRIVDGRIGKNKGVGNYACHTPRGSSLVDYVICNEELFP